jgi:hypothetical protein
VIKREWRRTTEGEDTQKFLSDGIEGGRKRERERVRREMEREFTRLRDRERGRAKSISAPTQFMCPLLQHLHKRGHHVSPSQTCSHGQVSAMEVREILHAFDPLRFHWFVPCRHLKGQLCGGGHVEHWNRGVI